MIEIFKTNIQNKRQAQQLLSDLTGLFEGAKLNVDLHDRDKILRVEGILPSSIDDVIEGVQTLGYHCEVLY